MDDVTVEQNYCDVISKTQMLERSCYWFVLSWEVEKEVVHSPMKVEVERGAQGMTPDPNGIHGEGTGSLQPK